LTTPDHTGQGSALEALWRRAEEIRALCGLPPITAAPALRGKGRDSAESLVEILLHDLEGNFRKELATRVQLEGLGDLMAFAVRDSEPDRPFRILLQYLARALNTPRLWLGLLRGNPPGFTLLRAGAGSAGVSEAGSERVSLRDMDPQWLRWLVLGEGESTLPIDPWGERHGGPWHPIPIRGEVPAEWLSGVEPACPGASAERRSCALTGAPLQGPAHGVRRCAPCLFRRVVGLMGIAGEPDPVGRASVEAIVPSLGALCVNLSLNEALDLEARFRQDVIESVPLGVVAIDREGQILAWNRSAEEILATPRAAALAKPIDEVGGPEGWHEALLRVLRHGGTEEPSEHIVRREGGSTIPVEVNAAPLRDAEGRTRGAVATLTDLSNLRSMEERIRQLDRLAALGRFASSVAHEIRNPLTGIATGVEYLSRGFPEGDERRNDVQFILREVSRLNSIIQDLLSATRPRMLTLGPVSVVDVTGRAIQTLGPSIQEGGVQIRLEGADHWPKVLADTDQLLQVILNLIQNAVQAMGDGGEVAIHARPIGNPPTSRVEIEISDTGAGIEPEHLPHLFEPFYTTRPKGTGLGLFVAHGIVQRHGGSIEVVSAPGRGTRFRILLPAAA
jgi:PAS domain S-box-containing protein